MCVRVKLMLQISTPDVWKFLEAIRRQALQEFTVAQQKEEAQC